MLSLDLYNQRPGEAVLSSGALASPQAGSSSPQLTLHVEAEVGDVQYQAMELLDSSLGTWGKENKTPTTCCCCRRSCSTSGSVLDGLVQPAASSNLPVAWAAAGAEPGVLSHSLVPSPSIQPGAEPPRLSQFEGLVRPHLKYCDQFWPLMTRH